MAETKKTEELSKKYKEIIGLLGENPERKYKEIIGLLGENPEREGLIKTPQRVAKAMQFFLKGYEQDPAKILHSAMFTEDYNQMVIVKNIDFYSLCEHHLVPLIFTHFANTI